MKPTPVRTAFLGAGMAAEVHQQALLDVDEVELAGVYDPNEELVHRRAEAWGVRVYDSVEAVLADPDIDAVHVLAPSGRHADLGVSAMEAGKHVLVEKPVASIAGIRRLAATASEYELVCMPGHNYAYQPEFERIRRLVHDAKRPLGDTRVAWITYCIQHPEEVASRYSGVLDEVMVHHTYLALALFGTPDWLLAGKDGSTWETHSEEDQAWMTWRYGGRLSVHMFASFGVDDPTSGSSLFSVKVLGRNGGASYHWADAVFQRAIGSLSFGVPAYEETYVHENRAFAAAIRGELHRIVSPIADALAAAQLAELAQSSASIGGPLEVKVVP